MDHQNYFDISLIIINTIITHIPIYARFWILLAYFNMLVILHHHTAFVTTSVTIWGRLISLFCYRYRLYWYDKNALNMFSLNTQMWCSELLDLWRTCFTCDCGMVHEIFWDIITHPYPNFNSDSTNTPIKSAVAYRKYAKHCIPYKLHAALCFVLLYHINALGGINFLPKWLKITPLA